MSQLIRNRSVEVVDGGGVDVDGAFQAADVLGNPGQQAVGRLDGGDDLILQLPDLVQPDNDLGKLRNDLVGAELPLKQVVGSVRAVQGAAPAGLQILMDLSDRHEIPVLGVDHILGVVPA